MGHTPWFYRLSLALAGAAVITAAGAVLAPTFEARALTDCSIAETDAQLDADEQAFLAKINAYRAASGIGALGSSPTLNRAAAWHASDMQATGYFSHTEPSGRTFSQRLTDCGYPAGGYRGENIASGFATADAVFEGWRSSPGHNENMLNPNFSSIGIGKAGGYWTTDFGSAPAGADGAAAATSPPATPSPATGSGSTASPAGPSLPTLPDAPAVAPTEARQTAEARSEATGTPSVTPAPEATPPMAPEPAGQGQARTMTLHAGFNYTGPLRIITAEEFVSCLGDSWTVLWYWAADEARWRWHFPVGDGPGQVPAEVNSPAGNGVDVIPGGRGIALYVTEDLPAARVPAGAGEGCEG